MLRIVTWFLGALEDEHKKSVSLTRAIFLAAFVIAANSWRHNREITPNHYWFLLVNLMYLFFKYKALDVLARIAEATSAFTAATRQRKEENSNEHATTKDTTVSD
jgi:hypothetical protein